MTRLSTSTRTALTVLTLLICIGLQGCSAGASKAVIPEDALPGTWKVDLRPTPDAEPNFKEFVVTAVQGATFEGTFYDTPISEGRINNDWGKLRIAFVTADASGPYFHSATLEHGKLEGLSLSTGRGFLAYWTAVKQQESGSNRN